MSRLYSSSTLLKRFLTNQICMPAVIALLHVLLYHPSLQLPRLKDVVPTRFIKTILLIVPVNTLENWINEFRLWTDPLECSMAVHNFHILHPQLRVYMIEEWHKKGGVLLIGDRAFANISKEKQTKKHKILREVGACTSCCPSLVSRSNSLCRPTLFSGLALTRS